MNKSVSVLKLLFLLLCVALPSKGQSPIGFDDICLRRQNVTDNFSCPNVNGTLICYPRSELCNGEEFCGDGSDEGTNIAALDCTGFFTGRTEPPIASFVCSAGEIVELEQLCDGVEDCTSGGDETTALCENKCLVPYYGSCPYTRECVSTDLDVNCGFCRPGYARDPNNIFGECLPALFNFSLPTFSEREDTGPLFASVTLNTNGIIERDILVVVESVAMGTATAGVDYTPLITTLTFPRFSGGGTTVEFNVTLLDDVIVENPETFQLSASITVPPSPLGGIFTIGGDTATAVINDNDHLVVGFEFPSYNVTEADILQEVCLVVRNDDVLQFPASVQVYTTDLLAVAGADYDAVLLSPPTSVTFEPESLRECFQVMIREDEVSEEEECFQLDATSLSSSVSVRVGEESTTVCIQDDDSTLPSCSDLSAERPHITCCQEGTQFCPIQCNQGVCRCVDPITGEVVGSGVFFDEGDSTVDCVTTFPEQPTTPPPTTTEMTTQPEPTTMEPTQPETTTEEPQDDDCPDSDSSSSSSNSRSHSSRSHSRSTSQSHSRSHSHSSRSHSHSSQSHSEYTSRSHSSRSYSSRPCSKSKSETMSPVDASPEGSDSSDTTKKSVSNSGNQDSSDSSTKKSGSTGGSRSRPRCMTVRKILKKGCSEECVVEDDDGCPACDQVCYEDGVEMDEPCANCTDSQVCLRVGRFGQRACVDTLMEGERCDGETDNGDGDDEETSRSGDSTDDSTGRKRGKAKVRGRIRGSKDRRIYGQLSEATPPCGEGLVCTRVALGRRECQPENSAGVCVVAREDNPELDCAADGSFESLQCRQVGVVFVCECVNPASGMAISGTEVSVTDPVDAPDCDNIVFQDCTVENGGETFSAPHGEYFIDISACMRCLCDNGEATLCEPSACMAISVRPTSCQFEGQEYSHGEQFNVDCNKCGCRNGRIECTHTLCEERGVKGRCQSCRRAYYNPVCAPNGKTYQSACSAIYCAGHAPFDLLDGPCVENDVCEQYPCSMGETCIKRGGISCFDPDGCEPDELRLCVDIEALQCDDVTIDPESTEEIPGEDGEDTTVCGTNGETYPSLCRLLQDTGNEGVAYAGECDREECDGGEVCGTDGVTYDNICVLRSQSGNARVDYYGECDVDETDPVETPEGICQRVSRARRCVYNVSNCRRLVRPEEGCCALCGGIAFVAIDFRGLGEYVKLNPRLRTLDDFIELLVESGFISEETTSRCEVGVSFTSSENLEITLEAETPGDEEFCGDESERLAQWINNPSTAADILPPQVLQFANAAVSGEPIFREVVATENDNSGATGFVPVSIVMLVTILSAAVLI